MFQDTPHIVACERDCVWAAFAISAHCAQNLSDLANFRCKVILQGCSLGADNTTLAHKKKVSTARSKFLGVPVSEKCLKDTTQGSRSHKQKRQADKKAHCGQDVWRLCELCGTTTHKNEALDSAASSRNSIPFCYALPCVRLWQVPHCLIETKLQFYICKIHFSKSF